MIDDWTHQHMLGWIQHAVYRDHVTPELCARMWALYCDDPAYWAEQGWRRVYAEAHGIPYADVALGAVMQAHI